MYKDKDKQKQANRLANKRYRDKVQGITEKVSRKQGITQDIDKGITDLTRAQLTSRIRRYPNDQWINSPEHNELMRRLRTWTLTRLTTDGYWIPAWRAA